MPKSPKRKRSIARPGPARTRALHALSHMRREKLSLAEACRLEHIKPATFLRHVGSAVRQKTPGGRYKVSAADKFVRKLNVPTALGPTAVPVRGSKAAREVSAYSNAVAKYLRTGKTKQLKRFAGKKVGNRKKAVELITDPQTLSALAQAGVFHLDQLYGSFLGKS